MSKGFWHKLLSSTKFSRLCGVVLMVFSVVVLVGCISYLFTWKEDSFTPGTAASFPESLQLENMGGVTGHRLGSFLVGKCFGLGAVVLGLYMLTLSVLHLFRGKRLSLKDTAGLLLASLLSSLLFAYVAGFAGDSWQLCFGGGVGGAAGAYIVKSMLVLFGPAVTPVMFGVLALFLFFLYFDFESFFTGNAAAASSGSNEVSKGIDCNDEEEDETPLVEQEELPDVQISAACKPVSVIREDLGDEQEVPGIIIDSPEDDITVPVEEDLPQLDIKGEVDRYKGPSLDLLDDYADKRFTIPREEMDRNSEKIRSTLASFKIGIQSISAQVGYTVTLYRIILADGVRVNQVKLLEDDIAIKIGIKGVRVVMLNDAVGIEVPNEKASIVPLKAILNSDAFRNSHGELPIALGYTITTKAKVFDLADAPHLLVAGATKQGKSVGLNAIIASLLYGKHPSELKMVFIDPKMVEFQKYSKLIRHYLALLPSLDDDEDEGNRAIVKTPKDAEMVLRSLCLEMDERYKLLAAAGVNKITDYNEKYRNRHLNPLDGHKFLPYLVVVVDEYADLTKSTFGSSDRNMSRSIENSINRIAAKGRAAGLHVIIATQRPSVDVITGTIKGNFPTRMAFRTAQRQDSMTILGMAGAEKLIGKGDMLFFTGADAERVQCALIDSDEIDRITKHIASQVGYRQACSTPYYLPEPGEADGSDDSGMSSGSSVDIHSLDSRLAEAAELAVTSQQISTSMIQRKMRVGFARAGCIMDQLEATGIVGPNQGARPREVLVSDLATLETVLAPFLNK